MMHARRYLQPVAFHVSVPERLLVRDEADRWFLWTGDEGATLTDIPVSLAIWLLDRDELVELPAPHLWFEEDALPVHLPSGVYGD